MRCALRPGPAGTRGVAFYAGDQLRAGRTVFTLDADAPCWPIDCVTVARQPAPMPDAATEPELHGVVQGTIDAVAETTADFAAIATYQPVALAADGSTPPVDFSDTIDGSIWIAVLKDPAVTLDIAPGAAVALSIGVSPAATTPTLDQVAPCPGDVAAESAVARMARYGGGADTGGLPRALPLRVAADTTQGFTSEGVVRIELPADLASLGVPPAPPGLEGTGDFPPVLENPQQRRQLWFWLRVWRSDGSRVGALRGVFVNALPVTQAVAARPELLGSGSGQPGQAFGLANAPVLLDALHGVALQVEESGVWTPWQQRDDLDAGGPADRHFAVDAEAATIRFGLRAPQIGERVRVISYRHGGGAAGNVPARTIAALGEPAPDAPPPAHIVARPRCRPTSPTPSPPAAGPMAKPSRPGCSASRVSCAAATAP